MTAPKSTAAETGIAQVTQQWMRDTAVANNIPLPDTALAAVLAAPPAAGPPPLVPEKVVTADTPAVIPVHIPASAVAAQQLGHAFPRLAVTSQAQGQLNDLANVTVGITTAAVNQGAEATAKAAAKSRLRQKTTGEGEREGEQAPPLDLAADFDAALALVSPDNDPHTFDSNAYGLDADGNPAFCAGDGIPDRAQLMLIQQAVNAGSVDFSATGGVSHDAALARWQAIVGVFHQAGTPNPDITSDQYASLERVVAGYCMIGDTASVQLGIALGGIIGWVPVDDAAQRSLLAPMPWQFSAQGNFTGTGYCNSAKWTIAREKSAAASSPDAPTFDAVFADYANMLDASIEDAQATTTTFYALTIEQAGEFLQPSLGVRHECAGANLVLIAIPDTPWLFDHWEVTPEGGATSTATTQTLALTLSGNMTVRVVDKHDPTAAIDFTFADRCLEQAVRMAVGKLTGDLLWGDVDRLTWLDAHGQGITSVQGIKYLTALTYLDLHDNAISDITDLGGLTKLTGLALGRNSLVEAADSAQAHPLAPLSGMQDLELLDLGWSLSGFNNGEWTSLGRANRIRTLNPLSSLGTLRFVDLCGNNIAWVSDSLSGSSASLQCLLIDDNPVLDLGVLGLLENLMVLSAQNTGLTDGVLSSLLGGGAGGPRLPHLIGIALGGNADLTTLGALAPYANLETVLCGDNPGLADIGALAGKTALNIATLGDTAVTDLAALDTDSFHDGALLLRSNGHMSGNGQFTPCQQVQHIESRHTAVDRDFACNGQALLGIAVLPTFSDGEAGTVVPFVGHRPLAPNTVVYLQAVQTNPAYRFAGWLGDVADPTNPQTEVYIDRNKVVIAQFASGGDYTLSMLEPQTYDVDANGDRIAGSEKPAPASVSPAPNVWKCQRGETRHLHAEPKPGWVFMRWCDEGYSTLSSSPDYDLIMMGNKAVRAMLAPAVWTLNMAGQWGVGTVTPDLGYHYYADGQQVVLHAEPGPGYCFAGWSREVGDNAGYQFSDADTTLTMHEDHTLWSAFTPCGQVPLTLAVDGFGYTNPGAGTHYYAQGSTVALTAAPYGDWRFIEWMENGRILALKNPYGVCLDAGYPEGTITALFDYPFELNDFQRFVTAQSADPTHPHPVGTFRLPDAGGVERDKENGHDMPDLVWLTLMYLSMNGGPSQATVTTDYWNNVQEWYRWLDNLGADDMPQAAEIHTYAAYSTLSENMGKLAVAHFRSRHPNATYLPEQPMPENLVWASELALTGDADGDGFSNIDEWLYSQWRYGDLLGNFTAWDPDSENPLAFFGPALVLLDTAGYPGLGTMLPDFSGVDPATVPATVAVVLSKVGAGIVYPQPGVYRLPTCSLSDWWTSATDGTLVHDPSAACATPMTFVAQAESSDDCHFLRWESSLGAGASSGTNISVPLVAGQPCSLTAVFSCHADISKYGKVEALRQFLMWRGLLAAGEDVYQSTFDSGGPQSVDDPDVFAGNGIPDVAEFALLDKVFFDDDYPADTLAPNPGITQSYAIRAFEKNRTLAVAGLAGTPAAPDWLADVVAGYMTLGSLGYGSMIRRAVLNGLGRALPDDGFDSSQLRYLGARNDADGDGVSNKKEWAYVASITPAEGRVDAFVEWALRTDAGHTPPPPTIPMISSAAELPACWNDTMNPDWPDGRIVGTVSKATGAAEGLGFKARVKLDKDDDGVEIDPAHFGDVLIPAGRVIELEVVEQPGEALYKWSIPGTLADGSNQKMVQFAFAPDTSSSAVNDLEVTAEAWPRDYTVVVPVGETPFGTYSVSLSGPHAELGLQNKGGGMYSAPYGSLITIDLDTGGHQGLGYEVIFSSDNYNDGCMDYHSANSSTATIVAQESGVQYVQSLNAVPTRYVYGCWHYGDPCGHSDIGCFSCDGGSGGTGTTTVDPVPHACTGICWDHFGNNTPLFMATPLVACNGTINPCWTSAGVQVDLGYYVTGWVYNSGGWVYNSGGTADNGSMIVAAGSATWAGEITWDGDVPKPVVEELPTLEIDYTPEILSAAAGSATVAPASKFISKGTVVKLTAGLRCGYRFCGWRGQGAFYTKQAGSKEAQRKDPPFRVIDTDTDTFDGNKLVTRRAIYLKMTENKRVEAIYAEVPAGCDNVGKYGVNLSKTAVDAAIDQNVLQLDKTALQATWVKASVRRESTYMQYDCKTHRPTGNPDILEGIATGVMQVVPKAGMPLGSVDEGTGLSGDEGFNIEKGTEYLLESCLNQAAKDVDNAVEYYRRHFGEPDPMPADAYMLEAVARYNGGPNRGPIIAAQGMKEARWVYWDLTYVAKHGTWEFAPDPPTQTLGGVTVSTFQHANYVRNFVNSFPWVDLPECPTCNCP